ncbi:adenine phosphoribosyltransferase [Spirochaeta cellobiosiphila]|uniref:adenine phosphoribosyltransferase n=1 Tax=Spirochaeta cellobiosiphila TaxID=504483 RepID=UPI0003FDECF2|nr:adenine phosphoribosyltransferase [Spirochaeta cellobiosiphila]
MQEYDLDGAIRKVPDFPKKGVLFYDISGILQTPEAYNYVIDKMVDLYKDKNLSAVAAIESRGFLFASPFAVKMGLPLVLIRKKGKLPGKVISRSFALEYGEDTIEVHPDDVPTGGKVLVIDDLIATGGTLRAACELIEDAEGVVENIFAPVGLPFLNYDKVIGHYPVTTLIDYHSE